MSKTNGYDPDQVRGFVSRLINVRDEAESEIAGIRNRQRADKNEILEEAKDVGIPKKELRALEKQILLERKAESIRDDLDADSQDTFDQLRLALGEDFLGTALGQAAAQKEAA